MHCDRLRSVYTIHQICLFFQARHMSENSSSVIDVSVLTSRIDPRASDSCDSLPACVVHFANKMIDVDGMEYYSNTSYDSWEILLHSGWSSGLSKRTET